MHPFRLLPFLLAALLILAACAGQPAAGTTDAAPAAPAEESMDDETSIDDDMAADDATAEEGEMADDAEHSDDMDSDGMAEEEMADEEMAGDEMGEDDMAGDESDAAEAAVDRPAWQQIALVDARTGEQFTLADFGDKPVLVEPFATWCGNCRRQLGNVQAAHASLGEDAVFIALSVEPNIANETLVDYAAKEGFEYTFAAMPPEMLQELAAIFGQTVANPPATPHFIILPDGSTTDLVTGFEAPDVLVEQLRAAGS